MEILHVDDNECDVELVARAINGGQVPCHLSVANSGLQALDYLHQRGQFSDAGRPHLILLDINLPGMNGKQVLETIKRDEDFRSIPTVMFTSSAARTDVRECYARNVNCYVVKPFDARTFIDVVRQIVAFWSLVSVSPSDLVRMQRYH